MDVTFGWRFIGPDGEKGDFHRQSLPDFLEALKISTVTAMENRASCILDVKAAEPSMRVMEHSCAPMSRRGECDLE